MSGLANKAKIGYYEASFAFNTAVFWIANLSYHLSLNLREKTTDEYRSISFQKTLDENEVEIVKTHVLGNITRKPFAKYREDFDNYVPTKSNEENLVGKTKIEVLAAVKKENNIREVSARDAKAGALYCAAINTVLAGIIAASALAGVGNLIRGLPTLAEAEVGYAGKFLLASGSLAIISAFFATCIEGLGNFYETAMQTSFADKENARREIAELKRQNSGLAVK